MNLIIVTAVIAVCGAANLDRTYLPPSSAANAGGSPGSLQTPLTRSSVQGLETPTLPSGSYTNDFGGVVVDAASPGTRASIDADQSNLGGPRQSYGSTDSKVGDAAFRGTAGFRDAAFGAKGQSVSGSFSNSHIDAHDSQFSNQNSNGQFSNGQISSFENKSERPQAAQDRNSNILALSNDVDSDRYSYGFETDNGIAVGENGVAVNGIQAEGGYSYQGDDGQVYKVTYTADEEGYRPQGAHLPTPPPIPEEILKSLEQNAKEEAAGIVDDGSYDAQKYNTEGDYTNDNSGNIQYNGGQLSLFGKRPESTATASGSFINQNGQAFRRSGLGQINSDKQNSHFNSQPSQSNGGSGQFGIAGTQNSNFAFNGQSTKDNGNSAFGQFSPQSAFIAESSHSNEKPGQFGVSGTQYNEPSSQGNHQHGSAQLQNTQAFFNGQTNQRNDKQGTSSLNSGTPSPQYSGNIQNIQIPGNTMPSTSSQGQSSFGSLNNFGSHASAFAQVQNQSPNSEFQQTQQGFNTQLNSEPKPAMTRPQFGSSFKPQGSEAFSGASLDQEQDGQDFGKPSPQTFSGQNFNRPNIPTGQVQANKFVSGTNNFNKLSQSSSQIGDKNEYLPPNASQQYSEQLQASNGFNPNLGSSGSFNAGSNFNSQVSAVNKLTPNFTPLNRQKPSLASASTSFSQTAFQSQPARPLNTFNSQTVATQPQPNQFIQQSSRFGQQNQFSSQNPQFNAISQQSGSFSQTGQGQPNFGTKPTSIPDTELTTPLEPNEKPAYSQGSQTTQSFGSFDSKPASNIQTQAQFGFQGNYAFGQQSSQSLSPSFPTSTPSTLQSPSLSVGVNPNKSFNKPQLSQTSFTQKQSSSNEGFASSYYHNQPSQSFGLTANRPEAPRFPSSSSYQSNGVASQNIIKQNSFSGKLPGSQSIAPVAPTAASQFNQQQNYNGITQAAISSFPSPSPTSSQIGMTQNNQFGSKPTLIQQSFGNQAQASKPLNQQTMFGNQFQTSGSQQSKPTFSQGQTGVPSRSVSQFGQNISSGSQTQNKFGHNGPFQHNQKTPGYSEQSSEDKPTVTQQYQGTIYEYNKPAQVLPAPTQPDSSSSQSIQSGVAIVTKPSLSQQSNQLIQQNPAGESNSKSDAQIKPFSSTSETQFGQISQNQQVNKIGSQLVPTTNQFGNTAQTTQFESSSQQQNVQNLQQPHKPFGFNSQSSFGSNFQPGSQTTQFSQNPQALVNSHTSQPPHGSSQSQFGSSTFENAAASQNNGYFYPNPNSQFPKNPQSIRPQTVLNQNTQNPFSQALFAASQQTVQSQFNSNSAPENSAQSPQTGQAAAQFSQNSPNSPVQPFGQSTASSQAVASGQATASASASLQQPEYKPFGSQDRNQFGLNNKNVQGQSTQQVAVQNLQTVGNSNSDDSLKPYGALNSHPGASTAESLKPLFSSACCKASKDSIPAQSADAPSQSSFQGVQNFNTQSFAGKGEEFGGPRQPPKFDETGYHY